MLKIDGIRLGLDESEELLNKKIIKILGTKPDKTIILKKAVDARRKNDVHFVYSVGATVQGEDRLVSEKVKKFDDTVFEFPVLKKELKTRPVVVGTGPCGSFVALTLARAGAKPIIIERGKRVKDRNLDKELFWKKGILNENSNVQFGEGGAGTFSDGKLNTGTHSPFIRKILKEYVHFGAPEHILYDAKPHIGTDILVKIAENMRKEIESLGGTYLFETKLENLDISNGKIKGINKSIETDTVFLAIGHSARDTFYMLNDSKIAMSQKPFSVGVRIEHPQSLINKIQYGDFAGHKNLPVADYKFGGDCYSFCMCPGGFVVPAASEAGGIVTNGMSYSLRDGENANSALLVNVDSLDFGEELFSGVEFQRKIEREAYNISGSFKAPCQKLSDFMKDKETTLFGSVTPTYEIGVVPSDITKILPRKVCENLKSGLYQVDRKMKGFIFSDALLTAPETRSSSPVRIERDKETLESVSIKGLYPCGEGAGYAGGIMSAAADGIRCALKYLEKIGL